MENNIQEKDFEIVNENILSTSIEDFVKLHNVDVKQGLSDDVVISRLVKYGENAISSEKKQTILSLFFAQFKDLLNVMLTIIAIVDFIAVPLFPSGAIDHIIQGCVILAIVIVNISLAIYQEHKSGSAIDALLKSAAPTAKVLRNKQICMIPTKEIVVGDVVFLEDGAIVPADLRLIDTNSLRIDESSLTGESISAEKDCNVITNEKTPIGDRLNFAFSSTIVTYGTATGVVVATGMNTEMGKIARLLSSSSKKKPLPPLKRKINNLTKTLSIVSVILLIVMLLLSFLCNAVAYYGIGHDGININIHPHYNYWTTVDTYINIIALAISLVPVALPITTLTVLSVSITKMAKRNCLCKQMQIVETIGNASVICSDKTGTLTLNKMTVTDVCDYDDIVQKNTKKPTQVFEEFRRYKHILASCMFCNNSDIDNNGHYIGDPTEIALLQLGEGMDFGVKKTRDKYARTLEFPFDSVRKMMSVVYKTKKGWISFTKGAAESILELCSHIQTNDGIKKISNADRKLIKDYLNLLSSNALRVLGFASREFIEEVKKDDDVEQGMTFIGLIGMIDPPRLEVFDAIKTCHEAGVKVAMITGDHQITALAIAHNLGIVNSNDDTFLTGVEIDEMSDSQLYHAVQDCCVYARVSPDNKLRIVKAFKQNDFITGMTGDGTNDAPALKEADIGIAMGISGTDVAKGAASLLLLDDNFSTIKSAINDGRMITRNIKNVISFILSTNLATALFIVTFTFLFALNPISVTQRLLLDLVTDTLPCIFIGLNSNDFGLMKQKPNTNKSLLDKSLWFNIILNALSIYLVTSVVFLVSYYQFGLREKHGLDIICFTTLSLSRVFISFNYVSNRASIFSKKGIPYKTLILAVCCSISFLFLLLFIPKVQIIVDFKWPKNSMIWLFVFVLPLLPIFIFEIKKFLIRLIKR